MKKLFLRAALPLLPFLLTACADSAALVTRFFLSPLSLADTAYSSIMDERSLDRQMDDAAIRASIRARLETEALADGLNVSIYSYAGNVFLMGEAGPQTRRAAVDAARRTGGVRRVVTHWFLQETGDLLSDLSIGARLRAGMIGSVLLSSTQIDTYTCGGNVLLLGMVRSRADEERALEVAHSIDGVRSVKSYLMF